MQDTSYHRTGLPGPSTTGSGLGDAALAYARRGVPVFRLRPGTKEPFHGSRGFFDATTNPETIRRWWRESPDANIGIPTGERSGLLVLDVDPDKGGERSMASLEDRRGELPPTRTHRTGSGGKHYVFHYPEGCGIRNNVGKLGPGLDVRGEGGYIVAPPSRTEGPYTVLEKLPKGDPPVWLIEALTAPPEPSRGKPGSPQPTPPSGPVSIDVAGPPIPQGQRNDELKSIAARLQDGTRSEEELTADLLAINEARCVPPKSPSKVEKMARWAHRLEPCAPGHRPDPERDEMIEALNDAWFANRAKGIGGKTDSSIERVLLREGARIGTVIPGLGLRVSIAVRPAAEEAGCHYNTVVNYTKRAREAGRLRKDEATVRGQSGAFILLDPRPGCDTQPTASPPGSVTVERVSQPSRAHEAVASPAELRTAHYRWRGLVGKGRERVLCLLEAFGPQSDEELAERLRWSRARDVRRYLGRLVKLGLVEERGGRWGLAEDHEERGADARREPYSTVQIRPRRSRSVEGLNVTVVAESGIVASEEERDILAAEDHARARAGFAGFLALAGPDGDESCREVLNRWDEEREQGAELEEDAAGSVREAPLEVAELERVPAGAAALVEALEAFLWRNPSRRTETASWLAVALWADDLVQGKPTPREVEAALPFVAEEAA